MMLIIAPYPSPDWFGVRPQPQNSFSGSEMASAASRRASQVVSVAGSMPASASLSPRQNVLQTCAMNGIAYQRPSILPYSSNLAPGTTSPYCAIASSTTSVMSSTRSRRCICEIETLLV